MSNGSDDVASTAAAVGGDPAAAAAPPPRVEIRGVVFRKHGTDEDGGDFGQMIDLDEYQNALFLFNGNVRDDFDRNLPLGGGSAVIRPRAAASCGYRATSIPTGWAPGAPFTALDDQTRMVIDLSFEKIRTIVNNVGYDRVLFPCEANARHRLGTSIFNVPAVVMEYINGKLAKLEDRIATCQQYISLPIINWICREHVKQRVQRECSRVASTSALATGRSSLLFGGGGTSSAAPPSSYPPRMSPFGLSAASARTSIPPRRAEPATPRTAQQILTLGKRLRDEHVGGGGTADASSPQQMHKLFCTAAPPSHE